MQAKEELDVANKQADYWKRQVMKKIGFTSHMDAPRQAARHTVVHREHPTLSRLSQSQQKR